MYAVSGSTSRLTPHVHCNCRGLVVNTSYLTPTQAHVGIKQDEWSRSMYSPCYICNEYLSPTELFLLDNHLIYSKQHFHMIFFFFGGGGSSFWSSNFGFHIWFQGYICFIWWAPVDAERWSFPLWWVWAWSEIVSPYEEADVRKLTSYTINKCLFNFFDCKTTSKLGHVNWSYMTHNSRHQIYGENFVLPVSSVTGFSLQSLKSWLVKCCLDSEGVQLEFLVCILQRTGGNGN